MAIPKISQPDYDIYFHSIKKKSTFRPYTTGQEKILLMVQASDDPSFIATNLRKVLGECITDPSVSIDSLASYDVENLLIKIKSKSSGETVKLIYTHPETKEQFPIEINLDELDVVFDPDHSYRIPITETVGFTMKDLTFSQLLEYQLAKDENKSEVDMSFSAMIDSIESIYDDEKVYKIGEETTKEELTEFVYSISGVTKKLMKFIDTMPAVKYKTTLKNGEEIVIKDIKNFLG